MSKKAKRGVKEEVGQTRAKKKEVIKTLYRRLEVAEVERDELRRDCIYLSQMVVDLTLKLTKSELTECAINAVLTEAELAVEQAAIVHITSDALKKTVAAQSELLSLLLEEGG